MPTPLAISVKQPWAWLILRPDLTDPAARAAARAAGHIKDRENRDWASGQRGWVLLHASASKFAKWDWAAAALFAAKRGVDIPLQGTMPFGAYVGAIRIDGCHAYAQGSRWFVGPNAFTIGASVPFVRPVVGPGTLNFFQVPPPGSGAGGDQLMRDLAREIREAGLAAEFGLTKIL